MPQSRAGRKEFLPFLGGRVSSRAPISWRICENQGSRGTAHQRDKFFTVLLHAPDNSNPPRRQIGGIRKSIAILRNTWQYCLGKRR